MQGLPEFPAFRARVAQYAKIDHLFSLFGLPIVHYRSMAQSQPGAVASCCCSNAENSFDDRIVGK
jgi:hypothetical protein